MILMATLLERTSAEGSLYTGEYRSELSSYRNMSAGIEEPTKG